MSLRSLLRSTRRRFWPGRPSQETTDVPPAPPITEPVSDELISRVSIASLKSGRGEALDRDDRIALIRARRLALHTNHTGNFVADALRPPERGR